MITVFTKRRLLTVACLASLLLTGYATLTKGGNAVGPFASIDRKTIRDYWYAGKAELTRYTLSQARYGELHPGEAVLIFVTEPFLKDKQVKHEFGSGTDATSVLKLNLTKNFNTGIYPYSIMTSIFTPIDFKNMTTLKVTSSVQDWCGQTFMQLNARDGGFHVESRSYFQRDADEDFQLEDALLEDEVWTRLRLAPESLPTGQIKIIPSAEYARLGPFDLKPLEGTASMQIDRAIEGPKVHLGTYSIDYQKINRKLVIRFERDFPHRIVGWEETRMSGFGPDAKVLTTTAVKTHSMMIDYWSRHKLADAPLRDKLGLKY
jgi:hypothetical protein